MPACSSTLRKAPQSCSTTAVPRAPLPLTAALCSPASRYMCPQALPSPAPTVLLERQVPHCAAGLAPDLGNAARIVRPAACACSSSARPQLRVL